jgi:outer membrane protein
MPRLAPLTALAALAALWPAAAAAQDGLGFTLRAGIGTSPDFFGSDGFEPGFAFGADFDFLRLGPIALGDPALDEPLGLGARASLRVIGERAAGDDDILAGLPDIDRAIEIGGGLRYRLPGAEAFAVLRQGFGGHEGQVAEIGADAILRPSDRLELRLGPRLEWGSAEFVETYFGVAPEDAIPGRPAFEPEAGIVSAGIEASVDFALDGPWGLRVSLRADRLQGDAADSPISAEDTQFSGFVGVTRDFRFTF